MNPNEMEISVSAEIPHVFYPNAAFVQTCGFCGCVFRVEIERQRAHGDIHEYSCPECRHHTCRVQTSTTPRVTMITARTDRTPKR